MTNQNERGIEMEKKVHFAGPVLFVRDIERSKSFFRDVLQQEIGMDFGECVGFKSGFSIWQLDHAGRIVFGRDGAIEPETTRWGELSFECPDVDAVWTRVEAAGVEIVHAVQEQPWGQRVLRARDPDGHLFEVGEPFATFVLRFYEQGMDMEAVSKRTSVPIEVVRSIVAGTSAV